MRHHSLISEMGISTIDKNQMHGKEIEPPNNELVEQVFRMASEKLSHCKSMMAFPRNIIDYFNDKDARLNN